MAEEYTSRIVVALLNFLMSEKINSLQFFMIANMIIGLLNGSPTPSQVINGVMLRGKKLI